MDFMRFDPGPLDHLVALILIAVLPVYAVWKYRQLEAEVEREEPGAKVKAYRNTLAMQWGLAAGVLLLWFLHDRSPAGLGLRFESGILAWVGVVLTFSASAYLVGQVVVVSRNRRHLESVRKQVESMRPMLPETPKESRWFTVISLSAGVCEELLFRGYLLAYMTSHLGIILGVILVSAAFGLGHLYQGPRGILKTGGVGLILAGLYLLTGSLWAPIMLHAVTDVTSGLLARRALALPMGEDDAGVAS